MTSQSISRRAFYVGAGSLTVALSQAEEAQAAPSASELGITGGHDAIHQEVVFKASAERVYRGLTEPKQFDKVVTLSGATTSMALGKAPTQISSDVGGAFSLFGGYITGRHVELTPNTRIIQAWRSQSWPSHVFSIARFELTKEQDGVRLVFDQTGFPQGDGPSLAMGWREHYWTPLAKLLA